MDSLGAFHKTVVCVLSHLASQLNPSCYYPVCVVQASIPRGHLGSWAVVGDAPMIAKVCCYAEENEDAGDDIICALLQEPDRTSPVNLHSPDSEPGCLKEDDDMEAVRGRLPGSWRRCPRAKKQSGKAKWNRSDSGRLSNKGGEEKRKRKPRKLVKQEPRGCVRGSNWQHQEGES